MGGNKTGSPPPILEMAGSNPKKTDPEHNGAERTLGPDSSARRFAWAAIVSLAVNAALWSYGAEMIHRRAYQPPPELIMTRVIITKDKKIVVMKPKPKVIPRPKPQVKSRIKPMPTHRTPPPAPHVHVMAAAPTPSLVSKREPTVLPGGNLTPGTPTDHQGTGNQTTPPPSQPTPEPSSAPQPVAPPAPQPTPPEPAPAPEPKPAPDPPKPAGPTQDAQPSNQVKPEIPDDLKQQQYKSFVRVKVTVSADGSFVPTLRTSSGNADIDARVLNALKQWKWKPALKDGTPIDSVAYFRFEFEVN